MRNFSFVFPFHFKLSLLLLVGTIGICSQHSYAQCWEEITIPGYEDYDFRDVQFADSLHGWIFGWGVVLKTSDGGENWTKPRDFDGKVYQHFGFVLDKDSVWVWGRSDTLYYTYNGGDTWGFYKTSLGRGPTFFTGGNNGWHAYSGEIFYTENGGKDWVIQLADPDREYTFNEIYMIDSLNGWAIGDEVFKTTNGGETWVNLTDRLGLFGQLLGIACRNKQNCWLAGIGLGIEGAKLYHTDNGGDSWTSELFNLQNIGFRDIIFLDSLRGWAVGGAGTILNTQDGGETWQKRLSGSSKNYYAIDFSSKYAGWIVGTHKHVVLKYNSSPPQCISVLYSPLPGDSALASIWDTIIWKPSTGCVNGYRISLGYTENGTEILNDYDVGYDTVFIPPLPLPADTTIYVTIRTYGPSGESGDCTSFHFRTEETSGIEESVSGEIGSLYIYPNPANDRINLKINVQPTTSLIVRLYSISGIEIFKSEIETIKAGWNEIPFNVSVIKEGLYFIRVETENGSITRKLSVF